LRNLGWLTAGDLAAKAATFAAFAHLARVVGTGLFGDFGFAVALTLYFRLIVSQGLDVYGIQEAARDRTRVPAHSAHILGIRLVSSVAGATALLICIALIDKAPHVKMLLLLCGPGLILEALSMQWVFQATEQMKRVAFANVVGQMVFSALALFFINRASQFLWIPVLQICGELAAAAYIFFNYRRQFGPVRIAFDSRAWLGILKVSLPMGIASFLSLVMFNFDLVLMGFLRPAAEVGRYSAAYKIVGFFLSLVFLYNRNLFPSVSRCKGDPARLGRIAQRTQRYVLLLALPLAAGGACLSGPLMRLTFGAEFGGGAAALAILIWIVPFASTRVLYRVTLVSHGFQNANLRVSFVAVVVNVLLNILLIPRFSLVGAAIASLSAEALLLCLTYEVTIRKVAPLPLAPFLWKPALASLVMVVVVIGTAGFGIVVRIGIGILTYAAASAMLLTFQGAPGATKSAVSSGGEAPRD